MSVPRQARAEVLARVVDDAHLVTGDQLSIMLDGAPIAERPRPLRFVTAVLARLNTETGLLHYLIAGHPPPLVVRGGRVVKELAYPRRCPLCTVVSRSHGRVGKSTASRG